MSATKNNRKSGRNNRRLWIMNTLVFTTVAAILLWIFVQYFHLDDSNYTNDAQVEAYINPINTRVSSYILEIRFNEHQKVKKGDTLLILDKRELLTQLGQAEAAYMNAMAVKNVSASAVKTVSTNVAIIESNIAAARARLWNAEQNFRRYQSLLKDEVVTQQQYDQMKTEYDAQKAQYEALLNQKTTSDLSIVEAGSKIGVNDTEIKRTSAALDMAKLNLSYTVITAPNNGVMGRRTINEGQLLQAGQQVATIVTDATKWVTANFREKQLPGVKIGTIVSVSVDGVGGKTYEGKIAAISEATGARYSAVPVDNSAGNFVKVQQRVPVRIEFTNANSASDLEALRAGMNVEVTLK